MPRFLNASLAIALVLAGSLWSASLPAAKQRGPSRPEFAQVRDVPGLPRVLLIGDSVSIGYTLGVRARLAGIANVHRPPRNTLHSANGLAKIDEWLGSGPWDVIHFNFGLHDLKRVDSRGDITDSPSGTLMATPDQYGDNLCRLVRRLQQTGATLVFATTTPVPAGAKGRAAGDEARYNAVALEVMAVHGVMVNDLAGFVREQEARGPLPAPPAPRKRRGRADDGDFQHDEDVHFTDAGYERLADKVAQSIREALKARSEAR